MGRFEGTPLVTAVIPVFNGERDVAEAIRSVLEQSYGPVECVVVDDGSTDGTRDVVDRFGSDVRCISTENRGVAAARNTGAAEARGEYVAFLDADDAWLAHKLDKQIAVLREESRTRMVCSSIYRADQDLRITGEARVIPGPDALRSLLLLDGSLHVPMTAMLPKAVFTGMGGFDPALSTSADFEFACRVALDGPVIGLDEPLALYREHPGQMHRDLSRADREMRIALGRMFAPGVLPDWGDSLRSRSYASLQFMLAVSALRQGRGSAALRYLARAVHQHPGRAARLAARHAARRIRWITGAATAHRHP